MDQGNQTAREHFGENPLEMINDLSPGMQNNLSRKQRVEEFNQVVKDFGPVHFATLPHVIADRYDSDFHRLAICVDVARLWRSQGLTFERCHEILVFAARNDCGEISQDKCLDFYETKFKEIVAHYKSNATVADHG